MNQGMWNGKQIFSSKWARLAQNTKPDTYENYNCGMSRLKNDGFAACGMHGQGYYFNAHTRHVCAWHSYNTKELASLCETLDN